MVSVPPRPPPPNTQAHTHLSLNTFPGSHLCTPPKAAGFSHSFPHCNSSSDESEIIDSWRALILGRAFGSHQALCWRLHTGELEAQGSRGRCRDTQQSNSRVSPGLDTARLRGRAPSAGPHPILICSHRGPDTMARADGAMPRPGFHSLCS